MVSIAMGAAMMGTMFFLWARCAQHGGKPVVGVWFASLYEVTGLYFPVRFVIHNTLSIPTFSP